MVPNRFEAVVASLKIEGYLLSPTHEQGGSKAKFFADSVSLNQIQANCRKHSLNTYKHEKSSKSRIRILGRSSQWNVKLRHLMGAIHVFILFGSSTNR